MSRLRSCRFALVGVSALSLSACMPSTMATRPAAVQQAERAALAARASAAIDRLVLLNALAQRGVAIFRPWLSPERAARVDLLAALADAAIKRVAEARDLDMQDEAIADAEAKIAAYKFQAGA